MGTPRGMVQYKHTPEIGRRLSHAGVRRGIRFYCFSRIPLPPFIRPPSQADSRTFLPFTGGLLFFIHGDLYAIQSETTVQVSRLSQPDGPGLLRGAYITSAIRIRTLPPRPRHKETVRLAVAEDPRAVRQGAPAVRGVSEARPNGASRTGTSHRTAL